MSYKQFKEKVRKAYPDHEIAFAFVGGVMEAAITIGDSNFLFQCLAHTDTIRGFWNGNPMGEVLMLEKA